MRATEYSPQQGRFQSQDPQAYDPRVPVTINPYEYAGNMPTNVIDASGMGWVFPSDVNSTTGDYVTQAAIGGDLRVAAIGLSRGSTINGSKAGH